MSRNSSYVEPLLASGAAPPSTVNQYKVLASTASAQEHAASVQAAASSRNLGAAGIPNQLGVSGRASSHRSVVTKNFLASQQGGFDAYGDPDNILEKSVISAARPGNVASVIGSMMAEEDVEDVHHILGCMSCWNGIPMTNNVKALIIMMVMFAVISIGQYFAADYCGSQALKADVISMGVDAISYLGNILGESSDIPAQRIVLQLIFSMLSIVLLLYFNTTTLQESIDGLRGIESDEPQAANPDAEGVIVIVFAGLGLVFDAICLWAYRHFAKIDAQQEYEAMVKEAEMRGENIDDINNKIKKPQINMFSALIHVSADLFRSTSTFILGILLTSGALNDDQESRGDSILAIIICATLYIAGATALYEWIVTAYSWFTGLGQAIEVECPEGIEPGDVIRIEPTKATRGKAADAFAG